MGSEMWSNHPLPIQCGRLNTLSSVVVNISLCRYNEADDHGQYVEMVTVRQRGELT